MFHPRTLALMLVLVLLLGGCIMPAAEDETSAPTEPAVVEPAPELPAEDLKAIVSQDANVRTGPGTDYAVAFWLTAGAEVTVIGRGAADDWLQIEHEDRPGWIFAVLTDIADGVAELPPDAPPAEPEPVAVEPTPEPTPEAVEPTPEPTPEAEAASPDRVVVTVTGTVVNLRTGPGTEHAINGRVRAGDQLRVTGRNVAGDWLQVVNPSATGEWVWIHAPLTDIDAATMQTLTEVAAVETEIDVSTPPEPTPTPPVPASVPATPTPVPAVAPAQPILPADCTQWHTVNPNETRLVQITDWLGLDLAAVARLNGLHADTPLTAGSQICLSGTGQVQVPTPGPETPAGSSPDALVYPVHPLSMDVGGFKACAIRANGSVACWRASAKYQVEPPPGVYSQIAVNSHVACVLRNDATVYCWGHEGGIIEPPGRYVEIDAGGGHTCGLTPSGRINCWGANDHNQATPPDGTFRSLGLGDIHSCAIRTDDTVICWGLIDENDEPPNKKFQSISGGANYTCGLLLNGELECWGTHTRPVTPPSGQFTSFDTGAYHACALRSNGEMVCWGNNDEGEGSPPPGPWKSVKCSFYGTCGVRIDGTIECWGMWW